MTNVIYRPKYETNTFCDVWDDVSKFIEDLQDSPFSNVLTSDNQTLLYYLLYAKYGNSPIANRDENQFKFKIFGTIFQYGPTWQKRLEIQETLRGLTQQQLLAGEIETLTGTDSGRGTRNTNDSGSRNEANNGSTMTDSETSTERDIANTGTQTNENDGHNITNHASNPPTSPVTSSTAPLSFIDAQDYNTADSAATRTDDLKTDDDSRTVLGSTVTMISAATVTTVNASSVTYSDSSDTSRNRTRTKDLLRGYAELWDLLATDVTGEFIKKFAKCFKQFVGPNRDWGYITEEDI